jgi:hypothetical protein
VSYPSEAFHMQELINGPKEVLNISLSLSFFWGGGGVAAANAKLSCRDEYVFLKTSWDSDNMKLVWLTGFVRELNGTLTLSRYLNTLLSCIGATSFYLCEENYLSTGSVCV